MNKRFNKLYSIICSIRKKKEKYLKNTKVYLNIQTQDTTIKLNNKYIDIYSNNNDYNKHL